MTGKLHEAKRRHAFHYLEVLRQSNQLYLQGGEALRQAVELIDLEWPNITAGQEWAAWFAHNDYIAAEYCNAYPDVGSYTIHLRQTPRERLHWLEFALKAAQQLNDKSSEARHLGNLGLASVYLGELQRSIEYSEQSLQIWRSLKNKRGECQVLGNLGLAFAEMGKIDQAIECYEKQIALAREIGDKLCEGNALSNLGLTYLQLNQTRHAIECFNQDLKIAVEMKNPHNEGDALKNLGKAHAALNETQRAVEYFRQALGVARKVGDPRGEGYALWNWSLLQGKVEDFGQAIARGQAAQRIFEQLEEPVFKVIQAKVTEWETRLGAK